MDLLLILSYVALCYAVFKIFKIPVNQWTLTTAGLGGVFMIGFILITMNYNHPYTKEARLYFLTTPVIPTVAGRVIETTATEQVAVKAGEVLFRLDPTPYQAIVDQKRAALAEAEQNVGILRASVDLAAAQVRASTADRDRAKQSYDRYAAAGEVTGTRPFSELEIENRREVWLASEGLLERAQAELRRAEIALASEIDGENVTVARIRAELRRAEFDLAETEFRAPTDGIVLQNFLRPGLMAQPIPLRPVMVFRHAEPPQLGAAFLQNTAQRVIPGADAEVIFDAVPGRVFQARVGHVVEGMSQGQLQPTGELLNPERPGGTGRFVATIQILDPLDDFLIVPGSSAQVAIYTEHWHALAIIRKILLRMKAWMNYIYSEGH